MGEQAMVLAAQTVEKLLARMRSSLGRAANQVELRLRTVEARHDPTREVWVEEVRRALTDGSFSAEMAARPQPEEILERWRDAQPA
jgi:hypothetical protein